jgi:hypothetical protein
VLTINQPNTFLSNDDPLGLCETCGNSLSKSKDKQLAFICNGIAVFFVLLAMLAVAYVFSPASFAGFTARFKTQDVTVPIPTKQVVLEALYHNSSDVTMKHFLKLKAGMKYEEVCQITGSEGTLVGNSKVSGVTNKFYLWQNPSGSNMGVEFRNGKLAVKTRYNLAEVKKTS